MTVSLDQCPPGLFLFDGSYGFKTEYRDDNGPEAYCVESGEYFWGGTSDREVRRNLMVTPLTVDPSTKQMRHMTPADYMPEFQTAPYERLCGCVSAPIPTDMERQFKNEERNVEAARRVVEVGEGRRMVDADCEVCGSTGLLPDVSSKPDGDSPRKTRNHMNEELKKKLEGAAAECAKKAGAAAEAGASMHFSQAALNLAHALAVLMEADLQRPHATQDS